MEPTYRHFADPATVTRLIQEIMTRHARPYVAILESMQEQLRAYVVRSFQSDTEPSRFGQVSDSLVRPRVLVGLSGGIDSVVVTYLAVQALGPAAVLPVTMPARPGDESVGFAALVRAELGLHEADAPYEIDIEPIVQAQMQALTALPAAQLHLETQHARQSREQKMRSGNFASRVRVAILADLQRAIRGRILGTVNRTEYCQGYGTKFGTPLAYDFGVLNELYKIEVYELGRLLGVPQVILDTPPTTGYFEGQTHAGELGASIEEQDIFSYLLFERGLTPAEIARHYGANEQFAQTMARRFQVSAHKRVINQGQEHARTGAIFSPETFADA